MPKNQSNMEIYEIIEVTKVSTHSSDPRQLFPYVNAKLKCPTLCKVEMSLFVNGTPTATAVIHRSYKALELFTSGSRLVRPVGKCVTFIERQ